MSEPSSLRFGTFAGVFRPISLTILGAMFYLREGWLVGNAGLAGAILVILAAVTITGITSLSLASIATNVRVRPGGAFAIVAQALGLEAGGAIGVPLYIAQALSTAMYVYAFSEAWGYVFPAHPQQWVALVGFVAVALLAWRSAALAFQAQAIMFGVGLVAIASALGGWAIQPAVRPTGVGAFEGATLLESFSLFFPAVTGIMVGAGMSGSLEDPRKSIPGGTLAAWAFTTTVYLLGAVWYATVATPEELLDNNLVMLDKALVGPLVLIGLLVSTLMAALSSLVAAPRLLQAMAEQRVVPGSRWLNKVDESGQPRNATLATTALAGAGLFAGSLDGIAPVITSFFLLTYLTINLVVWVESALGMISWRPTFRVPRWVSMVGVTICFVGLMAGSPYGGALELAFVAATYGFIAGRKLETPWETVSSGALVSLAAWAAKLVAPIGRSERAWKPDLLIPVATVGQAKAMLPYVEGLAGPLGTVRFLGLGQRPDLLEEGPQLVKRLRQEGRDASWAALDTAMYMHGVSVALDALQGAMFPPNLVFVDVRYVSDEEIAEYLSICRRLHVGLILHVASPDDTPNGSNGVNVWLSDRSPEWGLGLHVSNLDLPVLMGWVSSRSWGPLRLFTVVRDPSHLEGAKDFLRRLRGQARLAGAEAQIGEGDFLDNLRRAPEANANLFGMPPSITKERLAEIRTAAGAPCMFLLDSGKESALA